MSARIGRPRSLLVVAPHPDDETIGAHALMSRLRRRNVPVKVVVVSDGAGSHRASPSWPTPRLVRERRRETRLVLRQLGVSAGNVVFLGFPDGRLDRHAPAVRRSLARLAQAMPKPTLAFAPGRNDDHPDHRAVAASARRQPQVRWLAYPVWPISARLHGAMTVALTTQERAAKRRAVRSYRTQAGWITDDPNGFSMSPQQIHAFSGPQERFAEAGW